MKNPLRVFVFLVLCTSLFGVRYTASASEIVCTLSTSATGTGCVSTASNNFVAFAPSATPAAGTYHAVQSVVLSADGASGIHYTMDGMVPTCASGATYATPISVKKTQTIKAISCYPHSTQSAVSSFGYLLSVFDARTENAAPSVPSAGTAALPTQATAVQLSNATALDMSASVSTTSAGHITVGGAVKDLAAFTSGNLVSVDFSAPLSVAGQSVLVGKAVAMQSGVSGEPMVLSNQDFSSVNVSIPDGATVLAPSGWDGTLAPPRAAARAGEAPHGFSVGGTIVEVGSGAGVLLFDKPVSLVLSQVTGAVGYKATGSATWTQIANGCGGSYDTPSAPVFPGECYISNGTDTKIYTYHFTTFASLESTPSTVAVGGGGGNGPVGGGAFTAALGDLNNDSAIDIFDFNILLAAWGGKQNGAFYSGADLNRDGVVDISDFNILMAHWK